MSVLSDWVSKRWPKIQAPPEQGVEPVAAEDRQMGFWDYFVLWGDLGLGLLVMFTGSFLAPGLGLGQALLVILIGSVIGSLLLAATGVIAARTGAPTMVLLRAPLGQRGSYLPTLINVVQLVGWTIFEMIIIGHAANSVSQSVLGLDNYALWCGVFAVVVIGMGLGGPVAVVHQWLKKVAVWVMLATSLYLTYAILAQGNLGALLSRPGDGSLPFWVGVDLVIAMPVSWLPLVADYNRFARRQGSAFWGTFLGYLVSNAWFYALGVAFLMASGVTQEPKGFVAAVALVGGWLSLLILLASETDNAWADLYSSAVSTQNLLPQISQRVLILGLGVFSFLVAVWLDITQYELFLLLIGSLFVPLFGVLLADYFAVQGKNYQVDELYSHGARPARRSGFNPAGILAWLLGAVVYHLASPATLSTSLLPGWGQAFPAWLTDLGGSLPSFAVAFVGYWLLSRVMRHR
ncbi:MAG: putative hydroxymethylpyrimidine transporter CytX [Anaerolineaceae bacterium]|nr:putative hydroxymethylpyrimidine transporter CytX [Anaerolineaceae bacterium]